MDTFPDDILWLTLCDFSFVEIATLRCVCKTWCFLMQTPKIWIRFFQKYNVQISESEMEAIKSGWMSTIWFWTVTYERLAFTEFCTTRCKIEVASASTIKQFNIAAISFWNESVTLQDPVSKKLVGTFTAADSLLVASNCHEKSGIHICMIGKEAHVLTAAIRYASDVEKESRNPNHEVMGRILSTRDTCEVLGYWNFIDWVLDVTPRNQHAYYTTRPSSFFRQFICDIIRKYPGLVPPTYTGKALWIAVKPLSRRLFSNEKAGVRLEHSSNKNSWTTWLANSLGWNQREKNGDQQSLLYVKVRGFWANENPHDHSLPALFDLYRHRYVRTADNVLTFERPFVSYR